MQQYINDFLHYIRFEKRMSDKTYIAYKNDLGSFERFLKEWYGAIALKDIELNHLRSWIADLASDAKMRPASLQRKSSALKSFFKYLLRKALSIIIRRSCSARQNRPNYCPSSWNRNRPGHYLKQYQRAMRMT